ncbi:GNAT family N-acetyltransferase [Pseudomonas cremoricolorata]|uniref:GNAT family N-acetyltransferase n=1 Tax=Pseudomonas cremoricolorata TaxID=157783 RepID=UPI00040C8D7A|nr:GNAT family N-acetyltransferase [Pseudomonas cremoricolorata]
MQPTLKLLTPSVDEYPELIRVWESSVRATHDFLPEHYLVVLRDKLLPQYLPEVTLVCCKDERQRICGFVGVANQDVHMLFVADEQRGRGVGKRLLQHAIEVLGAERLDVNEQNPQALAFYQHQGFEVIGRSETDGLGQPYPLLHLRLSASK